jgi:integrase
MKNRVNSTRERVGDRVTIRPRGKKGIFVAEFWHDGQHRRRSLRTTNKRVARTRAAALEHQLSQGQLAKSPPPVTVREAIRRYLEHLKTEGRAPRTLTRYRGELDALADYLEGQLGIVGLSRITITSFDRFRQERRRNHKARTMYHEGVVAKQFLRWCVSRGLLTENPLRECRLSKPPITRRPAPTLAQVHQILEESGPAARDRILTLALTGTRVGELQALRTVDVDLAAGFINIVQQLRGPTKTGLARRVPIHPMLASVLQKHLANNHHELLFTAEPSSKYPAGGHAFSPKQLNDAFRAAAKRAGLVGFTQHSLRHFFIRHCINNGVPERAVRQWVGQVGRKDSSTSEYYDLTELESLSFMNQLSFDKPSETRGAVAAAVAQEKKP